jgi:hypothetical protein
VLTVKKYSYVIRLTQEEYKTIFNALILEKVRATTENDTARLKRIEAALSALKMSV